jgi:hypothetical protein
VRAEVLLAQLKKNLLMGLVVACGPLEGQDEVGEVREQIVAQRTQLPEIVAQPLTENTLLAQYVPVELHVVKVVLRHVDLTALDLLVVVRQQLTVGRLGRLEVLDHGLEVVDGNLGDPAVLVGTFEEGLKTVVGEEGGLDEVLIALH